MLQLTWRVIAVVQPETESLVEFLGGTTHIRAARLRDMAGSALRNPAMGYARLSGEPMITGPEPRS